jgi:hypothetical protein
VNSFGHAETGFENNSSIALASDDRVILAHYNAYVIDVFNTDGSKAWRLQRDEPWFPKLTRTRMLRLATAGGTAASIEDIAVRDDGKIVVLIALADVRETRRFGQGHTPPRSLHEQNQFLDFIIDVLDPRTGQVLNRISDKQHLLRGFVDGRHVYGVRETSDGLVLLDLWEIQTTQ